MRPGQRWRQSVRPSAYPRRDVAGGDRIASVVAHPLDVLGAKKQVDTNADVAGVRRPLK